MSSKSSSLEDVTAAAPVAAAATATSNKAKKIDETLPLPLEFEPTPYSVIIGRGKSFNDAVGNQRLRVIATSFLSKYTKATTKNEKTQIVSNIVDMVQVACPRGAAFIKLVNGRWWQVDTLTAREKVGYVLRDLLSDKYKSSSKAKVAKRRIQREESKQSLSADEVVSGQEDEAAASAQHESHANASFAIGTTPRIFNPLLSAMSKDLFMEKIASSEPLPFPMNPIPAHPNNHWGAASSLVPNRPGMAGLPALYTDRGYVFFPGGGRGGGSGGGSGGGAATLPSPLFQAVTNESPKYDSLGSLSAAASTAAGGFSNNLVLPDSIMKIQPRKSETRASGSNHGPLDEYALWNQGGMSSFHPSWVSATGSDMQAVNQGMASALYQQQRQQQQQQQQQQLEQQLQRPMHPESVTSVSTTNRTHAHSSSTDHDDDDELPDDLQSIFET
jgi:hypothetical protein